MPEGRRKPKPRAAKEPMGKVSVPKSMLLRIDRVIASHLERGWRDRNDFARRALDHYLESIQDDDFRRLALEAKQDGKPVALAGMAEKGMKL